ncbi:glycosyltransferase family 2 protein [Sphingomonas baiyangensis]|uniref:Glycosyltransferase n=1 Tax=Sphingomonas baiyangensis TaxID=2572576 RepID=A0A4U1L520_9SPHN|nr:glycosyltransferase family 2 protein [Sphingomonas baiyangensis]TKD51882.1 glycosyltransferase [Sphingomonas baiyangensis]
MKISIVTVAYNAAATIADTLASVAAQRDADIEHIVVDGASRDATMAIVEAHAHPRLRAISEPDRGLYEAMNKGAAMATGDYVGFLNSDDFFCRTDAASRIAARAAGGADAVSFGIAMVDQHDTRRVTRSYRAAGFAPWMLAFGHMPPHPGFYASRAALDIVGRFDPSLRIGADFDWMTRFYRCHGLIAERDPATLVTMREGGISTGGLKSMRIINREAATTAARHGVRTHPALIWAKYPAKALQLVRRPPDFPLPPDVAWQPAPPTLGEGRDQLRRSRP